MPRRKLDGLPEELVKQLSVSFLDERRSTFTDIREAFKENNYKDLNVDELLISLYDITGRVFKRAQLVTQLSYHTSYGRLVRVSKGVYRLAEEEME